MTMRKTKAWTKNSEEAKWLRENVKGRTTRELAEMMTKHFGYEISRDHVRNYIHRHKLKSGVVNELLSKEQYAWLKDNCAGLTYAAMQQLIADKFGVHLTIAQVNSLRSRYKMNSGLTGQFKKRYYAMEQGKTLSSRWTVCRNSIQKRKYPTQHQASWLRTCRYRRLRTLQTRRF